jgi:hypothetical protein
MSDEEKRMWKQVNVARSMPGKTEETHEDPHSG